MHSIEHYSSNDKKDYLSVNDLNFVFGHIFKFSLKNTLESLVNSTLDINNWQELKFCDNLKASPKFFFINFPN